MRRRTARLLFESCLVVPSLQSSEMAPVTSAAPALRERLLILLVAMLRHPYSVGSRAPRLTTTYE